MSDVNALEMTDDEFEKLTPSQMEFEITGEEVQKDGLQDEEETNEEVIDEESTEQDTGEAQEEPTEPSNDEGEADVPVESKEEPEEAPMDFKQAYEEVFKPFKANGKEIQVSSIEDVRQLMQMGANYNKKMAGLKPHLKIVKMLEKNNLLDEDKLNYLIDLSNKNPDAVKKLLKDSEIDPLDVNLDEESNYKPNSYNVSDKEVELDSVLNDIQDTESFQTTIDILGNKWDQQSKQVIVDNPQLVKIINDHVSNGIYEKISRVVENERLMGRLNGLSDIEAYKQVGDALNAQGYFNNLGNSQTTNAPANNNRDPKLTDRKKAASPTKGKPSKPKNDFNPLAMSDEEFEKFAADKFM